MTPQLYTLLRESYRELRPRAEMPVFELQFYPFANINNTIRLREGKLKLRIADVLEGAPEPVLRAIVHILLAKIYRKPIDTSHATRYRRYISSRDMQQKAHLLRQIRGRKRIASPRGHTFDLDAIFEDLNQRFFYGLLARPRMTWSAVSARNSLGHYDPAHNAIVVSRIFDRPQVPLYAIEYLVYHEMLHLKHPVRLRGSRRCVHGPEFHADEKLFPQLEAAKNFLKTF